MTQQEFVNMNRGINDSGDLPTPFLVACYQAIVTNEIKIKEFELVPQKEAGGSAARPSKTKLFHMESAMMVKRSQELFKAKARKKSVYHSSRSVQHVQPMFEASWCAVLAACSSVMEAPEEETPEAVVALTLALAVSHGLVVFDSAAPPNRYRSGARFARDDLQGRKLGSARGKPRASDAVKDAIATWEDNGDIRGKDARTGGPRPSGERLMALPLPDAASEAERSSATSKDRAPEAKLDDLLTDPESIAPGAAILDRKHCRVALATWRGRRVVTKRCACGQ